MTAKIWNIARGRWVSGKNFNNLTAVRLTYGFMQHHYWLRANQPLGIQMMVNGRILSQSSHRHSDSHRHRVIQVKGLKIGESFAYY